MAMLTVVVGDTLPVLYGIMADVNDVPIDITTGYDIKLHIDYQTPLVKDAVIPTGTDGLFKFLWDSDDFIEGTYNYEIQVTTIEGVITTQYDTDGNRLKIKIRPQIA